MPTAATLALRAKRTAARVAAARAVSLGAAPLLVAIACAALWSLHCGAALAPPSCYAPDVGAVEAEAGAAEMDGELRRARLASALNLKLPSEGVGSLSAAGDGSASASELGHRFPALGGGSCDAGSLYGTYAEAVGAALEASPSPLCRLLGWPLPLAVLLLLVARAALSKGFDALAAALNPPSAAPAAGSRARPGTRDRDGDMPLDDDSSAGAAAAPATPSVESLLATLAPSLAPVLANVGGGGGPLALLRYARWAYRAYGVVRDLGRDVSLFVFGWVMASAVLPREPAF